MLSCANDRVMLCSISLKLTKINGRESKTSWCFRGNKFLQTNYTSFLNFTKTVFVCVISMKTRINVTDVPWWIQVVLWTAVELKYFSVTFLCRAMYKKYTNCCFQHRRLIRTRRSRCWLPGSATDSIFTSSLITTRNPSNDVSLWPAANGGGSSQMGSLGWSLHHRRIHDGHPHTPDQQRLYNHINKNRYTWVHICRSGTHAWLELQLNAHSCSVLMIQLFVIYNMTITKRSNKTYWLFLSIDNPVSVCFRQLWVQALRVAACNVPG